MWVRAIDSGQGVVDSGHSPKGPLAYLRISSVPGMASVCWVAFGERLPLSTTYTTLSIIYFHMLHLYTTLDTFLTYLHWSLD
jgi:hypothetical protein